jgi:hypothetical protein
VDGGVPAVVLPGEDLPPLDLRPEDERVHRTLDVLTGRSRAG